ncbi:hypothetical protein [Litchfieldia salsa]|uniref:hypothetical protein n=1 Tax=Litchfieldia salsa TaxID=930152 RepID=UPI0015872C3D|nr:hypothetical protein [Litchfieldia salsa]
MTVDREIWILQALGVVTYSYFLGSIPSFLFYFKRRKQAEFSAFLKAFGIFILPYVLTVIIIRIIVLDFL